MFQDREYLLNIKPEIILGIPVLRKEQESIEFGNCFLQVHENLCSNTNESIDSDNYFDLPEQIIIHIDKMNIQSDIPTNSNDFSDYLQESIYPTLLTQIISKLSIQIDEINFNNQAIMNAKIKTEPKLVQNEMEIVKKDQSTQYKEIRNQSLTLCTGSVVSLPAANKMLSNMTSTIFSKLPPSLNSFGVSSPITRKTFCLVHEPISPLSFESDNNESSLDISELNDFSIEIQNMEINSSEIANIYPKEIRRESSFYHGNSFSMCSKFISTQTQTITKDIESPRKSYTLVSTQQLEHFTTQESSYINNSSFLTPKKQSLDYYKESSFDSPPSVSSHNLTKDFGCSISNSVITPKKMSYSNKRIANYSPTTGSSLDVSKNKDNEMISPCYSRVCISTSTPFDIDNEKSFDVIIPEMRKQIKKLVRENTTISIQKEKVENELKTLQKSANDCVQSHCQQEIELIKQIKKLKTQVWKLKQSHVQKNTQRRFDTVIQPLISIQPDMKKNPFSADLIKKLKKINRALKSQQDKNTDLANELELAKTKIYRLEKPLHNHKGST